MHYPKPDIQWSSGEPNCKQEHLTMEYVNTLSLSEQPPLAPTMTRPKRDSLRRISTLDTIEEASSTDYSEIHRLQSVALRRASVGFAVNVPVNERPQRRFSDRGDSNFLATTASPLLPPRPTKQKAPVSHSSARFRHSMFVAPSLVVARPPRLEHTKPAQITISHAKRGSPSDSNTVTTSRPQDNNVPSYARPTAASKAKARKREDIRQKPGR